MSNLAIDPGFTYQIYKQWNDGKRWEIIDGVAYAMAAPLLEHQDISGELYGQLWQFLKGKKCKVYHAPFDVRLNADTFDNIVVQPDILVICDNSKLDRGGIIGAPDFIIEILSPKNIKHDTDLKFNLYQAAGVKEYWIVDPQRFMVKVYILQGGLYGKGTVYTDNDIIPVHTLPGCSIDLSEVFDIDDTESEITEDNNITENDITDIKLNIFNALKNNKATKQQLIDLINDFDK